MKPEDNATLTPEIRDIIRRSVSIDGDGNVIGHDNQVTVVKQQAGSCVLQIGECHYDFTVKDLRRVLHVENSQIGIIGDHATIHNGIHFHQHLPPSSPEARSPDDDEKQRMANAYFARIVDECRYLESSSSSEIRIALNDVFVMLEGVKHLESLAKPNTSNQEQSPHAEERDTDENRERKPVLPKPLTEALAEDPHLVVLGEPGTGKTTLLQYLALSFAKEGLRKVSHQHAYVPVPIALREYNGADRLDRFLIQWLDRVYVPESLGQNWLDNGQLVILLDGLDEVDERDRAKVINAIRRFASSVKGRKCRIVLTSRIDSYQGKQRLGLDFGHYTIHPLNQPKAVLAYTLGWMRAFKPETTVAEAESLIGAMKHQDGLDRLGNNPLLIHLAVVLYFETDHLILNRVELYHRYIENVVWKRARAHAKSTWTREQFEEVLEELAYTLQINGKQTATELATHITQQIESERKPELLAYVRKERGILTSYGYGQRSFVAFRHLSFQEYFTARKLARAWFTDQERVWEFLSPRLHHPDWFGPTLFLAEMLGKTGATQLAKRILDAGSAYESELHRDLRLVAAILGRGAPVASDLAGDVTDRLTHLYLDVNIKTIHRWFLPAAGGLLFIGGLILFRHASHNLRTAGLITSTSVAVLMLSTLISPRLQSVVSLPHRLSGKGRYHPLQKEILRLLNTLPKDLKLRVIDAMIARLQDKISEIFWVKWDVERAITSFGTLALPPLRIAAEDDNPNVRDAAQSVMQDIRDAERFKLSLRALRDEQWEVRHAAARRFGRLGDRRAIESLQHALSDENPLVREAVANALQQLNAPVNSEPTRTSEDITFGIDESLRPIKVAADHADTDTLLQMLEHFDFATRQAAEEALMSLNEPDIDRLSQALDDGDPQIRQVVVWALGSYEDPHVIEPLKDGLKDEHPMVRWSAAYALGQFGELAVAPLIQALEDETAIPWVIATELGRLGDPLAVEPLLEALTDSNDELRQAAAEALAMLAPKIESLQLLRKVARALWWQLTDIQSVASAAWKALAVVVATRTERDITERNEADSQPFTLTNSA